MTPRKNKALARQPPPGIIVRAGQSLVQNTRRMLGATPVPLPVVDPQLGKLPVIERAAEVVRYSVLRAEYWMSAAGTLRAVLRISIKVALLIGMPTLIIGPVVMLLLEGAVAASALLLTLTANLLAICVSLLMATVGFAVLLAILRSMPRRK